MRKNMVVFAPIRYLNRIYVVLSSISPLCQMSSLLNICAIWTNLSNLLQTKSHWLFTITLKIFHQKNSQFSQYKSSKYDHWPVYGIAYIQNMLDSIWLYTFFFATDLGHQTLIINIILHLYMMSLSTLSIPKIFLWK